MSPSLEQIRWYRENFSLHIFIRSFLGLKPSFAASDEIKEVADKFIMINTDVSAKFTKLGFSKGIRKASFVY